METARHTGAEYVSFIALIGSLFVVSGGIHINVKGEATPAGNVLFLLTGALLANVLGTTGASMLLIRPWLRMNKFRVTGLHVVFFIFIVSNVGGCLTPIGDPPLFLGYLKGVPFWWVAEHCWPMWATGLGILLGIFMCLMLATTGARRKKRARGSSRPAMSGGLTGWGIFFPGDDPGHRFHREAAFRARGSHAGGGGRLVFHHAPINP